MRIFLIFIFICVFVGCVSDLRQKEPLPEKYLVGYTALSESEVVEIAINVARRRGINIEMYKEPFVSYKQPVWFISFEQKGESVPFGGSFSVSVNEEEKYSFFSPGR